MGGRQSKLLNKMLFGLLVAFDYRTRPIRGPGRAGGCISRSADLAPGDPGSWQYSGHFSKENSSRVSRDSSSSPGGL